MKRIGILGGTFDPPHLGHLIIAEETRLALDLEEIWFIPTNVPPHKSEARTSSHDRLTMLKIAINTNHAFKIHDVEIQRTGKSYTYDTMKILRQNHPKTDFYFIIGGDMVEYLPHWHQIDELQKIVKFVGIKRSNEPLSTRYPIIEVHVPTIDISATFIRNRLQKNKTVRYFTPPSVYDYIKEAGLYGTI